MLRFTALLLFGFCAHANNLERFEELFSNSNVVKSNCTDTSIQGNLSVGCYECYLCDDERIKSVRKRTELTLTDHLCTVTKVCCIAQENLQARDGEVCGVKVPEGRRIINKAQIRKHVRSVLEGEYPWRAWVYRKGKENKPLCAGSIVHDYAYLMTSATCVHKYSATDLVVTFNRDLINEIEVEDIAVHEHYKRNKPNINDIAIITLNKHKTPTWAQPVCLPFYLRPPMHATSCVVMSDEDYYINTVIPLPIKCSFNNKALHVSQICATAPLLDYVPETGAGLFCDDELRSGNKNLLVYGITLEHRDGLTIYTNVSHFSEWIDKKVRKQR